MRTTRQLFPALVALFIGHSAVAIAEPVASIDYDEKTDLLVLQLDEFYLDDALDQLSKQVKFELVLGDNDLHHKVSFDASGKSGDVIEKLVQPNSVVLFRSEMQPNKVTRVELLPMGDVDSTYLPKDSLEKSRKSAIVADDAGKNQNHKRRYERKLKQQIEGPDRTNIDPEARAVIRKAY